MADGESFKSIEDLRNKPTKGNDRIAPDLSLDNNATSIMGPQAEAKKDLPKIEIPEPGKAAKPIELALLQVAPGGGNNLISILKRDIAPDLKEEAQRLLPHAGPPIWDFYEKMRQAQRDHVDCPLNIQERALLAGWMLFPENDPECNEGKAATAELVTRILDRNGAPPANEQEREKDNHLKAFIYSLLVNDHDYFKNPHEPERDRTADHHLPTEFIGVGINKEGKLEYTKFNIRWLVEYQKFATLQGTFVSPLSTDYEPEYKDNKGNLVPAVAGGQRANVDFCMQVMRGILPARLLSNNPQDKADRDAILAQNVELYRDRPYKSLPEVGTDQWRGFQLAAKYDHPSTKQALYQLTNTPDSVKLSDAEKIYEELFLDDIRQLVVEKNEMILLQQFRPAGRIFKSFELARPDLARLEASKVVKVPLQEYDNFRRYFERYAYLNVADSSERKYIGVNQINNEKDLRDKMRDYGYPHQLAYLKALPLDPALSTPVMTKAYAILSRYSIDCQNRKELFDRTFRLAATPQNQVLCEHRLKIAPGTNPYKDYVNNYGSGSGARNKPVEQETRNPEPYETPPSLPPNAAGQPAAVPPPPPPGRP